MSIIELGTVKEETKKFLNPDGTDMPRFISSTIP
jgi:hypothetical protein